MSVAAQTRYKEEYIAAFERTTAVLPPTIRSDVQDRGGSLVFLVAGSGGRTAVTRGSNGLIPPADDSQSQVTLTFAEAHDLRELTNFDIFRSQGDQTRLLREESMGVIHRKQDAVVIAALEAASVTLGAVGTMNMTVAQRISTILRNGSVGSTMAGNVTVLLSPAAFNYMMNITAFANSDYTRIKKVDDGIPLLTEQRFWMGMQFIAHEGLTGVGTTATCLAYHKDSAGYAMSTRGIDAMIGYDEKQDTSWARASLFHGAKLLQNSGVVKFTHDDTGLSS